MRADAATSAQKVAPLRTMQVGTTTGRTPRTESDASTVEKPKESLADLLSFGGERRAN
jgi:hypothetical protein